MFLTDAGILYHRDRPAASRCIAAWPWRLRKWPGLPRFRRHAERRQREIRRAWDLPVQCRDARTFAPGERPPRGGHVQRTDAVYGDQAKTLAALMPVGRFASK